MAPSSLCNTRLPRRTTTISTRQHSTKRKRPYRTSPSMHNLFLLGLFLVLGVCQAQEERRQVQKYALPAFSLLLKLRVDEIAGDDDNQIYLDLEIFQETLERVTQLHLTDIFQQADGRVEFDEQFLRVQLSSKVRQDVSIEHTLGSNTIHVPLQAGFSGIVSYSFPTKAVLPPEERVDELIRELLESALVGESYMLLFRRYLSSGVLADIEDIQDVRIGTELLNVIETPAPHDSSPFQTRPPNQSSGNKHKQLNAVTIVAIVIFLTLSCLLMLFGATVVLLMNDRAKQEEDISGQAIRSIGMGTGKKTEAKSTTTTGQDDDDDSDDESTSTTMPVWKQAVLPFLRKAVMVRRYWRKHLRKQRRARRKQGKKSQSAENPNEAAASPAPVAEEEDDGLNDEDVYYDDNLTDEEAANQWLDAWSQSITSIPVRNISNTRGAANSHSPGKKHIKKKKTSKMPLAPHPAKRQSKKAFLCCIAEEDSVVDTNSVMEPDDLDVMTPPSSRRNTNNTTKICLELDRIQELASVVMEEGTSSTEEPASPPALTGCKTFPGAYGSSARKKKLPAYEEDDEELQRIQDVDLS